MDHPIRKNALLVSLAVFTLSYTGLEAIDCSNISTSSDYNQSITGTSCVTDGVATIIITGSISLTDSPNVLNSSITSLYINSDGGDYTISGTNGSFDLLTITTNGSDITAKAPSLLIYNDGTITLNATSTANSINFELAPSTLGSHASVILHSNPGTASLEFNSSGTSTANLSLISSGFVNVVNYGDQANLAGSITGDQLLLSGTGTIELSGSNSYSRGTSIYEPAILIINGSNSLGSGPVQLHQGSTSATLKLSATLTTPTTIDGYSASDQGNLFINNGATVTLGDDVGSNYPLSQIIIEEGATLNTSNSNISAAAINVGNLFTQSVGNLNVSSTINGPITVQGSGASTITVLSGTTSGGIVLYGDSVFIQSGGNVDNITKGTDNTGNSTLSGGTLGSASLNGSSKLVWSGGSLGGSGGVVLNGSSQLFITGTSAVLSDNIRGQAPDSPSGSVYVNADWTPGYTLGASDMAIEPLSLVEVADGVTLTLDYTNPGSSNIFATNVVLGSSAIGGTLTVNGEGIQIIGDIDGGGGNPSTPNGVLNVNQNMFVVGNIGASVPLQAINCNSIHGYLTLSGSCNVSSLLVGTGATMDLGSSALTGTLNVTGTVKGVGTAETVIVESGGTIAPGNSPGTIYIGSLTLNSGSTTTITIDGNQCSEIILTGSGPSGSLAGILNVVQDSATVDTSGSFPIIEGNYSGVFDSLLANGLPGYEFSLSYVPNFVYLLYNNTNPTPTQISTLNLSGNGYRVANYLNNNASSSTIALFTGLSDSQVQSAMNSVSPSRNSFGSYAATQTMFGMSNLLSSHVGNFRSLQKNSSQEVTFADDIYEDLTADASDEISIPPENSRYENRFSGWITGFGEFAHLSSISQNPSFRFNAGAVLAGLDVYLGDRSLVGGSLGYAHTHYYEGWNAGHGNTNSYIGSVYGNAYVGDFYLTPAIWGVFNQTDNTRNISFPGFEAKASSEIFSWQMIPHLEVGYDFAFSWGDIIPFTSADWALSWQRGYTEHGASPFNAKQKRNNSSMARSETGLRFSEKWIKSWGAFILKEKASYVFEKPFGTGTVNTSFVGTPSGFTVTAVNQNLNLGAIGMNFLVSIGEEKPIKVDLGYEGEFGSNFWSNDVTLTLSKAF